MPEIIRQGDPTTHGGVVLEGSMTDICHGKPIAYIGHKVQCPKCNGAFPIVEGVMTTTFFGRGVAVAGMKTACGASLIATQFTDVVEWAGGGAPAGVAASQEQALEAKGGQHALAGASSLAARDQTDEDPVKRITRLYWSYGIAETPVTDVSRHYVDLNLHIETENYQSGESAVVVISNDDGSNLTDETATLALRVAVSADGTAKVTNVFRNKTVEIGTFS